MSKEDENRSGSIFEIELLEIRDDELMIGDPETGLDACMKIGNLNTGLWKALVFYTDEHPWQPHIGRIGIVNQEYKHPRKRTPLNTTKKMQKVNTRNVAMILK